jgi:nucleoside-diphosphate-sugar epimerase
VQSLITGAGGFLGGYVVERLAVHNHVGLRCLVRSATGRLVQLKERYPSAKIECVTGNHLSQPDLAGALDGVDTVYHLAAAMRGAPADLYLNTVVASKRLLDACRGVRRIVLVSSFGVYGVTDLARGAMLDENTPLEKHPEKRDPYSMAKWRQEKLFHEYQDKLGFELIVLRPGVIYGPGNRGLSTRIGVKLPGFLLHVGKGNVLPLTYVENCAEAIAIAGSYSGTERIFNVVDDDLITCREYLKRYKDSVEDTPSLPVPYWGAMLLFRGIQWYSDHSQGQLPAVLTPYKAAALWRGNRFRNEKIKKTGWRQLVSTADALRLTLETDSYITQ